jgi:hypothetical protein
MSLAAEYRRYAAECIALSERVSNLVDKARLIDMAQAFLGLADKQERRETDQSDA